MAILDDHLSWMRDQQHAGNIIAAGPSPDRGLGIMVLGHMSAEKAQQICDSDPFVRAGHRTYDVIGWDVHHVLGIGGFDRATVTAMMAAEQSPPNDRDGE